MSLPMSAAAAVYWVSSSVRRSFRASGSGLSSLPCLRPIEIAFASDVAGWSLKLDKSATTLRVFGWLLSNRDHT